MRALLPAAANGSAADALLLAFAAERAGRTEVARDALLAIGAATRAGAAIARASSLTSDLAADRQSLELTSEAYALAQMATEAGNPRGARSRAFRDHPLGNARAGGRSRGLGARRSPRQYAGRFHDGVR